MTIEEKRQLLEEIETALYTRFKPKTVIGMIKSTFNDHPKMERKLLYTSIGKRVHGGITGLLVQILKDQI